MKALDAFSQSYKPIFHQLFELGWFLRLQEEGLQFLIQ